MNIQIQWDAGGYIVGEPRCWDLQLRSRSLFFYEVFFFLFFFSLPGLLLRPGLDRACRDSLAWEATVASQVIQTVPEKKKKKGIQN